MSKKRPTAEEEDDGDPSIGAAIAAGQLPCSASFLMSLFNVLSIFSTAMCLWYTSTFFLPHDDRQSPYWVPQVVLTQLHAGNTMTAEATACIGVWPQSDIFQLCTPLATTAAIIPLDGSNTTTLTLPYPAYAVPDPLPPYNGRCDPAPIISQRYPSCGWMDLHPPSTRPTDIPTVPTFTRPDFVSALCCGGCDGKQCLYVSTEDGGGGSELGRRYLIGTLPFLMSSLYGPIIILSVIGLRELLKLCGLIAFVCEQRYRRTPRMPVASIAPEPPSNTVMMNGNGNGHSANGESNGIAISVATPPAASPPSAQSPHICCRCVDCHADCDPERSRGVYYWCCCLPCGAPANYKYTLSSAFGWLFWCASKTQLEYSISVMNEVGVSSGWAVAMEVLEDATHLIIPAYVSLINTATVGLGSGSLSDDTTAVAASDAAANDGTNTSVALALSIFAVSLRLFFNALRFLYSFYRCIRPLPKQQLRISSVGGVKRVVANTNDANDRSAEFKVPISDATNIAALGGRAAVYSDPSNPTLQQPSSHPSAQSIIGMDGDDPRPIPSTPPPPYTPPATSEREPPTPPVGLVRTGTAGKKAVPPGSGGGSGGGSSGGVQRNRSDIKVAVGKKQRPYQ